MDEDEGGFCPDSVLVVPSFCEEYIYIYIVFFLGRCIIWDKMDRKIVEKKCVWLLVHLKNEINDNNSVLTERDLQLSSYYLKSKSIRLSYESFSFFSMYYKLIS